MRWSRGNTVRYPLSLFVGRQREAATILSEIGGSLHSRIAVQGAPGVGKTTLVNHIKAELTADGVHRGREPRSAW